MEDLAIPLFVLVFAVVRAAFLVMTVGHGVMRFEEREAGLVAGAAGVSVLTAATERFLRLCLGNHGRRSARERALLSEFSDGEVAAMEQVTTSS